ncbi:hypothetical protein C1631_022850 [Chryseobacterium phosphatilyticum]|uniref:DUF4138 domain-containing protein n=1 Tax=Chryseobacterium phosphatilyticum TaxID=475075 RepID=A0A316WMB7_9FLAO|nr:DUF4138 domain-containing protein [Chryseobacterium phosphatilyticum]PWN62407.1 hypothetical protein C1631_022850 [Chryseobacterium phosphatilyticum]
MKKNLVFVFLLVGFLGFSQHTKKKGHRKSVKKTYVKKATPKVLTTEERVETVADPLPVAEPEKVVTPTVEAVTPAPTEKPNYEILAEKVLKEKGWIHNRNSALINGVEGFVKGVYSGNGKIFVLLEIANRSNINYDIESAVFITAPIEKNGKIIDTEEKTFIPIFSNQPESFSKKSKQKLVYVFDKFTISGDKTLHFVMNEIDGERSLTLEIKPKYILESASTK